ncbi:hypothetical protein BJ166DRAFT_501963 [Pestalotiopsis sp. NC0098]|nr:hypothetical protein BJ166DRAFT_501963 [Pestalotiopsis sp. NC0098]
MDTLLETGNRRHSRMALMAARSRSMPPNAIPRLWSPESLSPSVTPGMLSPKGRRPSVFTVTEDDIEDQETSGVEVTNANKDSYRVPPRRVSKIGKCFRHKKKAPLVIVLQTNGNSSRYSLIKGNELAKVTSQQSDLGKPLPPCPPEYDTVIRNASGAEGVGAQNVYRQSDFDLEAQREKTERCRFWILATFTVITGLGTIVLVLIEVLDFFPDLKGGAELKGGGE